MEQGAFEFVVAGSTRVEDLQAISRTADSADADQGVVDGAASRLASGSADVETSETASYTASSLLDMALCRGNRLGCGSRGMSHRGGH